MKDKSNENQWCYEDCSAGFWEITKSLLYFSRGYPLSVVTKCQSRDRLSEYVLDGPLAEKDTFGNTSLVYENFFKSMRSVFYRKWTEDARSVARREFESHAYAEAIKRGIGQWM